MFATAAGFTLFAERSTMKPHMLLNDPNVPLITDDQPVINALAVQREGFLPVSTTTRTDRAAGEAAFTTAVAESGNRPPPP